MGRLDIIVPTHDRAASLRRDESAPRIRGIREEQQGRETRLWFFTRFFRERCLARQ